MFNFIYIH